MWSAWRLISAPASSPHVNESALSLPERLPWHLLLSCFRCLLETGCASRASEPCPRRRCNLIGYQFNSRRHHHHHQPKEAVKLLLEAKTLMKSQEALCCHRLRHPRRYLLLGVNLKSFPAAMFHSSKLANRLWLLYDLALGRASQSSSRQPPTLQAAKIITRTIAMK